MHTRVALIPMLVAGLFAGWQAQAANDFEPQMKSVLEKQIREWLRDPVVVEAVKAQNAKHSGLTDADIDKLDKQWRAEAKAKGGATIEAVLGAAVSKFLSAKKKASDGLFTEIFVMDNKGLNVGQSDITTDYMQGDEAKWQKTFKVGPNAVFVDEVDFDESTGSFQAQLSATITDAAGAAIGAITVGMNVEKLP